MVPNPHVISTEWLGKYKVVKFLHPPIEVHEGQSRLHIGACVRQNRQDEDAQRFDL